MRSQAAPFFAPDWSPRFEARQPLPPNKPHARRPMDLGRRVEAYKAQTGRPYLTRRQWRRFAHKAWRIEKRMS